MQWLNGCSARRFRVLFLSALTVLSVNDAWAIYSFPGPAPIDRMIANTQAHIDSNPNDPRGYYTLGRLHYLAFIRETSLVNARLYDEQGMLPSTTPFHRDPDVGTPRHLRIGEQRRTHFNYEAERRALEDIGFKSRTALGRHLEEKYSYKGVDRSNLRAELEKLYDAKRAEQIRFSKIIEQKKRDMEDSNWEPPRLSPEDLNHHVSEALAAFYKVLTLDSTNYLARLGLASLKEQYHFFLADTEVGSLPEMKRLSFSEVAYDYYLAHNLAFAHDKRRQEKPDLGVETLVSYEAGKGFLRVFAQLGDHATFWQKVHAKKVKRNLKKIDALPNSRTITPIIFSLSKGQKFSDLPSESIVEYDLSGYGVGRFWPWVKPSTYFLVYDPNERGQITSARQMFGSYSFEIPFANGFEALSLLDDDGNGELSGHELSGIAGWSDVNGNGVSDSGEVIPVQDLGVLGVKVDVRIRSENYLGHPEGLRLKDGTVLPLWDWLVTPIR